MNAPKLIVAGASAAAAAAVTFALVQIRDANWAVVELEASRQNHIALQAQIASWESKAREASRRAVAAERDTAELLSTVNSLRAQPVPMSPAARVGSVAAGSTSIGLEAIDASAARTQRMAAAVSDGATAAAQSRAASGAALAAADQARLAQERAYQQALAKKRAAEAIDRAKFDEAAGPLDPAAKYSALIERARTQAAAAEFSAAIRTYNEAMTVKPADLPVSTDVRELQALLQAQNRPVDVALVSDGETFVSIANTRAPARFASTIVKLLPGDYEIVGQRAGYREVRMLLQVRNGEPPPVVTVICSRAVRP